MTTEFRWTTNGLEQAHGVARSIRNLELALQDRFLVKPDPLPDVTLAQVQTRFGVYFEIPIEQARAEIQKQIDHLYGVLAEKGLLLCSFDEDGRADDAPLTAASGAVSSTLQGVTAK